MSDKYQPLRDALASIPRGWGNAFDEARKHPDEDGIAQVGSVDEDQRLYPVIEVNCDEYYAPEDSLPLARYIAAAKPETIAALLKERDALRDALQWYASMSKRMGNASIASQAILTLMKDIAVDYGGRARAALADGEGN